MSSTDLYQPLLEIWLAVEAYKEALGEKPGWNRSSKLKKAIQNGKVKLTEECQALINKTVDTWDSDESLADFLASELNSVREHSDPSWHAAIDGVRDKLVELARKESSKGPTRRKIEKYGWLIGIATVAIVMVFLKWYWLVDVTKPVTDPSGISQRAKALEKVLDYDDSMDTRVRRGGWLKGILFWPAEPTGKEIEYASEFLWGTVEIYDYLKGEGALCGSNLQHSSDNDTFDDELAIAKLVISRITEVDVQQDDDAGSILVKAFMAELPCK
jgi:hypothetical protein